MIGGVRTGIRSAGAASVPNTEKQRPVRRTVLRRLTGIGAAVVGAVSVTWADAPKALAGNVACCDLANPNGPWCGGYAGNNGNFTCPSGCYKTFWTCYYNGYYWNCWECSGGPSCYDGPWPCSNYYRTNIQSPETAARP